VKPGDFAAICRKGPERRSGDQKKSRNGVPARSGSKRTLAGFMIHISCRLTAKNRDQLRNPMLINQVWAIVLVVQVKQPARCVSVRLSRNLLLLNMSEIIGTARILGLTAMRAVHPSVRPSVLLIHSSLLRVCCCGPARQEISADCCTPGGPAACSSRAAARHAAANTGNATLSANGQVKVK